MKATLILGTALGLISGFAADADLPLLKDEKARLSYAIGMNLGSQWREQEVDVDPDILLEGMKTALAAETTLLTEAEARQILSAYQTEHRARLTEKRRLLGETNKKEGEDFLAENKTKPGVITLPSGLQYKVVEPGEGESPKPHDVVTVNYTGRLIDGTEFDSSARAGQPLVRPANRLIAGWTEALQLMKPGATWELYIPSNLAYGERGSGSQVGPNATLIFDVELVSFEPTELPPVPKPAQPVTSDIIKVPSRAELEQGAKIEVIKADDLERIKQEQEKSRQQEQPE